MCARLRCVGLLLEIVRSRGHPVRTAASAFGHETSALLKYVDYSVNLYVKQNQSWQHICV